MLTAAFKLLGAFQNPPNRISIFILRHSLGFNTLLNHQNQPNSMPPNTV